MPALWESLRSSDHHVTRAANLHGELFEDNVCAEIEPLLQKRLKHDSSQLLSSRQLFFAIAIAKNEPPRPNGKSIGDRNLPITNWVTTIPKPSPTMSPSIAYNILLPILISFISPEFSRQPVEAACVVLSLNQLRRNCRR